MILKKQTAIGAFVLGGLVLTICAVFLFTNINLFSTKEHAIIIFPGSVTGLSVGAPVTFRGVQVGSVDSINLQFNSKDHQAYIPVAINIDSRKIRLSHHYNDFRKLLEKMIQHGLCAEISTESFVTGTSNIFLDFDLQNKPEFHPNMAGKLLEIPVHPSAIQKIKSELMNLQLQKLSTDLDSTIQKIGQLTDNFNKTAPALLQSIKNTSDNTNKLVSNINGNINKVMGNLNKLLVDGDKQLNGRGKELHGTLLAANKTLMDVSATLNDIRSMTSTRSPSRTNLEILLKNLADASTSLRGFSREIERNPKLLLIGRKQ